MPIKTICSYPGCVVLVDKGRCEEHSRAKYAPPSYNRTGRNNAFYKSKEWRKLRLLTLNNKPLCELQVRCNGRPATEVDHITPIQAGGERLDPDNLQSVCKFCHSYKTATIDLPLIRQYQESRNGKETSHRS